MDIRVTYCFGSKREVLDGSTIVQWLDTDHKGDVTIDRSKVEEYVRELSVKFNTAYCTKKLETSYGQVVSITKGHYGWMIDKKSEIEALIGIIQSGARACLKIHSRHLHAPLRGIFGPNSVNVARYASLIGTKSPTKWDAQLTESNFQTRSRRKSILRPSVRLPRSYGMRPGKPGTGWTLPALRPWLHVPAWRCASGLPWTGLWTGPYRL